MRFLDYLPGDGETEPRASVGLGREERVEDPREHILGNAGPVVFDFQTNKISGANEANRNQVLGTRPDLIEFVTSTGITPQIGQVLPMDRAEDGFRAMWEGRTSGKIIFTR